MSFAIDAQFNSRPYNYWTLSLKYFYYLFILSQYIADLVALI